MEVAERERRRIKDEAEEKERDGHTIIPRMT
jgi:hypothetical protein